jgi:opacity protein-like surface antigen
MASFCNCLVAASVATVALAAPARAQERSLRLYARSGGLESLNSFPHPGAAGTGRRGRTLGGGVGLQLSRFVSVRGDFTYARYELHSRGSEQDDRLERFYYDAVVRFQYPTAIGLEPYVFAGGGAVRLRQAQSNVPGRLKPAGSFGLGVSYAVPGTRLGLFVESKGWVYDRPADDRLRTDRAWTVGLSYRLPLH